MIYTLNIESGFFTNNFRLQDNEQWLRCSNPAILCKNDYTSNQPSSIINIQIKNISITIDGEEFEIESEDGCSLGDESQLHYSVYGFRKDYPNPPDENQLMTLLSNGNDSVRNILVLMTDGIFYLLQQNQILDGIVNPNYVLQFEGFQPGNNYVGITVDRNYVLDLYRISIYHWKKHLIDKELHDFAEIKLKAESKIPEIIELFSKLNDVKNNWQSDY